jgi:hypothetical protein
MLPYVIAPKTRKPLLGRSSANRFYDLPGNVISFEATGGMKATLNMGSETFFSGTRVQEHPLSEADLAAFAGEYRSTELDGTFGVSFDQASLVLRNNHDSPIKLISLAEDEFDVGGFYSIVFHRDAHHKIIGLSLFSTSARGIEFNKTN